MAALAYLRTFIIQSTLQRLKERQLNNEQVFGAAIMVCLSGLCGWSLFKGFRSGTMEWAYFGLSVAGNRRTMPGKFWTATLLQAIPFSLGIIGFVSIVLWPHGIGN